MKDFESFAAQTQQNKDLHRHIETKLRREFSQVPAVNLMGQNSVNKLVHIISDISLDICLSTLRAYHEWNRNNP